MTRPPDVAIGLRPGQVTASLVGRLRAHGHPFALADLGGPAPGPIIRLPDPGSLPPRAAERALLALIGEMTGIITRRRAFAAGSGRLSAPRGDRALRVGLTGGIGTGKSTVARLLAERGAGVVDADAIAREVLVPGGEGMAAVIAAFGAGVLHPDGSLDRGALASRIFGDAVARARLDAITLPCIAELAAYRLEAVPAGGVAVYDVPLLAESGIADLFDFVLVVESPMPLRLARLEGRGLPRAQAVARIGVQATDAERRALADAVLVNDGALEDLADGVARLWDRWAGHALP